MKAVLIARTWVDFNAAHEALGYDSFSHKFAPDADELAEIAGRNCYRSFERPNPATRENVDYIKHILDVGHESVLEHASATFYIESSRSVLTELERHRHLSFSVVSQRYVDVPALGYHVPPAFKHAGEKHALDIFWRESVRQYNEFVDFFVATGKPRKEAREAARSVLPNMTNSPMVVTGNHRAWRYVIKARWHQAADAEIREVAGELLKQLRVIAPATYQDIPDEPYTYADHDPEDIIRELEAEVERLRAEVLRVESHYACWHSE